MMIKYNSRVCEECGYTYPCELFCNDELCPLCSEDEMWNQVEDTYSEYGK